MWTKAFWLDATERAVKTGVQSVLALLLVDGVTVLSLDWANAGAVAGTAALVSIGTSIVSTGVGRPDSASMIPKG